MTELELFEQTKNLVYHAYNEKFAEIPANRHIKEDIIQEGMLALWKACKKFDSSRGVKFASYAYSSIYKSMMCYATRQHKKTSCTVSLNEIAWKDNDGNTITYTEMLSVPVAPTETKCAITQCLNQMDKDSQSAFNYTVEGYTQGEIAEKLQISQAQVSRMLRKIKRVLKDTLFCGGI